MFWVLCIWIKQNKTLNTLDMDKTNQDFFSKNMERKIIPLQLYFLLISINIWRTVANAELYANQNLVQLIARKPYMNHTYHIWRRTTYYFLQPYRYCCPTVFPFMHIHVPLFHPIHVKIQFAIHICHQFTWCHQLGDKINSSDTYSI